MIHLSLAAALALPLPLQAASDVWTIASQAEWLAAIASQSGVSIQAGLVEPTGEQGGPGGEIQSVLKVFAEKRTARSVTLTQSAVWQNWEPTANLGPANLQDAPVLLTVGPGQYWMFGRYGATEAFKAEPATLAGFDVPLMTTEFANQFDAPGGVDHTGKGYHAWESRDMVHWVHHGRVTEALSRWVTSAEYVDGKTYIYYDYPNDQDPHLYIDDDLTDGVPGKNMGIAFKDPSHGSDSGFIRDLEGRFHVIYEDWSPINASKRSWDSPLAGHAVSPDGIGDFEIQSPAVDHRTRPTGVTETYKHPHWLQHPDFHSNLGEYEVHAPEQPAYGDWASICIGGQYYLFGDHDPVGGHRMSVGWFTSSSIDEPFTWCDRIGEGHPDPDIAFAEGRFYLATQQKVDYVSSGPWVEGVEVRVGVDTSGDGEVSTWTPWESVRETYDYLPGFSKQIGRMPAALDLSGLPAGFGFQFEVKLRDTTANKSKPMLKSLSIGFE